MAHCPRFAVADARRVLCPHEDKVREGRTQGRNRHTNSLSPNLIPQVPPRNDACSLHTTLLLYPASWASCTGVADSDSVHEPGMKVFLHQGVVHTVLTALCIAQINDWNHSSKQRALCSCQSTLLMDKLNARENRRWPTDNGAKRWWGWSTP